MTYLLDTDHISILGRRHGPLHRALVTRLAALPESEFGFSIISYHGQLLGCHKFIQAARTPDQMVRGYEMLEDLRRLFATASSMTPPRPSAITTLPADCASARWTFESHRLQLPAV